MRQCLPGFYRPTEDEFKELWATGLVVLDANVLLNVYRYPAQARIDLLRVLELLKERLWIPFQVAAEFQRNRVSVIQEQRRNLEALKRTIGDARTRIDAELIKMELERRAGVSLEEYSKSSRELDRQVENAIDKALDEHPSHSLDDPIRLRLDELFADRVGDAPTDQAFLDVIGKEGLARYELSRPPGYKDASKKKDIKYVLDGLTYDAQFGDLLLWKQLISHVKAANIEHVIFVTSDGKEDWWQVVEGAKVGPQPELISEIRREGGVKLFWMYEVSQFLTYAQDTLKVDVQEKSIRDVKDVELQAQTVSDEPEAVDESGEVLDEAAGQAIERRSRLSTALELKSFYPALMNWLGKKYPEAKVEQGDDFPDVTVHQESAGVHGFEFRVVRRLETGLATNRVHTSLLRGAYALKEGALDAFTLVLVLSSAELERIRGHTLGELSKRLLALSRSHAETKIILGAVSEGVFYELATAIGGKSSR